MKPDVPSRLVITAGVHHREQWYLRFVALLSLLVFLALLVVILFPAAFPPRYQGGSTNVSLVAPVGAGVSFFWFLLLFPIVSWKYVTVLDRTQGKVIHSSGFIFWKRKTQVFDLKQFNAVFVGEKRATVLTPQGEIEPEFIRVGDDNAMVRNAGHFIYHRVSLSGPETALDLKEFYSYPGAHRLAAKVAAFLELPGPPMPPSSGAGLSMGTHVLLTQAMGWLCGMAGLAAGFAFTYAFLRPVIARGGWVGPVAALGCFALMFAGYWGGTTLASRLPTTCLWCGGQADRMRLYHRTIGLQSVYRCLQCGFSHRP